MANETAFPQVQSDRETFGTVARVWSTGGMSKRELYAVLAMQAIRSAKLSAKAADVAKDAVADADALIAELGKAT